MKIERPPATLELDAIELIEAVQEWLDRRFEHREAPTPQVDKLKEAELNVGRTIGSADFLMGQFKFTLKPESE